MQLLQRAINQKQHVEQELKTVKKELKHMPKGNIHCRRRGDVWRWYYTVDGEERSMNKNSQKSLAEKLAYKRRLQQIIEDKENEIIALDCYIKIMTCGNADIRNITIGPRSKISKPKSKLQTQTQTQEQSQLQLQSPSQPRNLALSRLITYDKRLHQTNDEVERLANAYRKRTQPAVAECEEQVRKAIEENIQQFAGRDIDINQYKIKSNYGLRFRSKSEALIYERLRSHGLLVLYEKSLKLPIGITRSPDFTIYRPATDDYIIWEHFGMMDSPGYLESNHEKLHEYFLSGYLPGINMIATFEAGDNALNLEYIDMLIETFFE